MIPVSKPSIGAEEFEEEARYFLALKTLFTIYESVAKTPLFFEMKWNEKRGVIYLGYHS